ncbi:ABC transporter permease [Synoicihabitans lomoniglobus]|uniref:ABC transporter permease n=1 Tax=Synoicihabitans lomoniglobus TaxID=2909285 RepID=A0AAF0CIS4_9BACT|nr:ABC transporter permease [Opitutaceae bacterium LMO-M01]WED65732.1 ABC transporter permease [Opitutaceae bacterium LMO-M01]
MKQWGRTGWLLAVVGVVLLAMAIMAPGFYEPQPLLSLFTRKAPLLVMVTGMTLVILTRQIDISVGSVFSVAGVVAAIAAAAGWPLPLVFAAAMASGALLGACNAVLVAGLGLPSIVVTLAMMVAVRQGLNLGRQGRFVELPEGVQWFGWGQLTGQVVVLAIAVVVTVTVAWGLRHLAVGRWVYAVGSDAEAARLAGIRPRRVTFGALVAMGMFAGLAAALNMVQSPQLQPSSGTGFELEVIAAVVVGGVAISGGRGRLSGACVGLVLLMLVAPALTHLRVPAYWEKAIQGAVILAAAWSERERKKVAAVAVAEGPAA